MSSPPPKRRRLMTMEADDIHGYLSEEESRLPAVARSEQLGVRYDVVHWLITVCNKFDVDTAMRHLAVTLLDFFIGKSRFKETHLKLVGLGSLRLAG